MKTSRPALALAIATGFATGCDPGPATRRAEPATTPPPPASVQVPSDRGIPEIPEAAQGALDPALREMLRAACDATRAATDSAEAWGRYAQVLQAAEFVREARIGYRRAAELAPDSVRWLHLLGLLELADDEDAALTHLGAAAQLAGTTNDAPRLRLAQALIERGRPDAATPHLKVLLEARPDHPAARLELGRVHFLGQRLDEAAALLAPCTTNPYTARAALQLLSQMQARQGRPDEAAVLARRAAALPRPFDWPDVFLRDLQSLRADRARQAEKANALLQQRRFAEAETILAELQRRLPDDPEVILLSGRAHLLQRRFADAEERFRASLRLTGPSLNGLVQLALAQLGQERWTEAAAVLEQAIALKPDFAQAHANLAIARSRQGNTAAAIASYRDALRCSPGDAATHAALAEEMLRGNDRAGAAVEANRALELDPAQPRARALAERLRVP